MGSTTVVFETENGTAPYLVFALREAFAVHLNTQCALESIPRPKLKADISENAARIIASAKKVGYGKYTDGACVYVAPGALSFTNERIEFEASYAWVLTFLNGKLTGADYRILKDEPEVFSRPMANICACMAGLRPVVAAPEESLKQAKRLISTTFEGLQIAHQLMESDYPSHGRLVQ